MITDLENGQEDRLTVGLRCVPGPGDVGLYIQRVCQLYLGIGREPVGPAGTAAWGPCPERAGRTGDWRCTAGPDGLLASLNIPERLGPEDWIAVALRCTDADDPARAEALQQAASVGWAWPRGTTATSWI
ncbi:MAG: hypothetical protein R3F43_31725 [bacterium]